MQTGADITVDCMLDRKILSFKMKWKMDCQNLSSTKHTQQPVTCVPKEIYR